MKNRPFRVRLGYALDGVRVVWQREASFRTQCMLAVAALGVTAIVQPGYLWTALVVAAIALVLALELINSALEDVIDKLHPQIAPEMKRAKDAAAAAVLIASLGALVIGAAMLAASVLR